MTILLIEDNPDDVKLAERALRQAGFSGVLAIARDASEAFDYLRGEGLFSDRAKSPSPDLILLDLTLPKVSGLEVLTWLKSQEKFAAIPVFVLTGNPYGGTVTDAYRLGAKTFFFKPLDVAQVGALVGAIRAN